MEVATLTTFRDPWALIRMKSLLATVTEVPIVPDD
jgi:hypothetical protein